MSYTSTSWKKGDVITPDGMNNIESGLEDIGNFFEINYVDEGVTSGLLNNADGVKKATGENAVSFGIASIASGKYSVAGGVIGQTGANVNYSSEATGPGSVAFGGALASNISSFAIGGCATTDAWETSDSATYCRTVSDGACATALGLGSKAHGHYSLAGGQNSRTTGNLAIAWGSRASAEHASSCALGPYTKTGKNRQTVIGEYNEVDATAEFVVGVGDSTTRANCFTTGNDGTEDYLMIGETKITESQLIELLSNLTQ